MQPHTEDRLVLVTLHFQPPQTNLQCWLTFSNHLVQLNQSFYKVFNNDEDHLLNIEKYLSCNDKLAAISSPILRKNGNIVHYEFQILDNRIFRNNEEEDEWKIAKFRQWSLLVIMIIMTWTASIFMKKPTECRYHSY
jgi:hypothetical protein